MGKELESAKQLIGSEIDPDTLREAVTEAAIRPEQFEAEYPGMTAGHMYIKAEAFVAVLEMAKFIGRVLQWNRKGRLVIEYDPEKAKFTLAAIRIDDAAVAEE